jgi:CGNR zinc finger
MKITADSLSPFCLGSYIWVWDPPQDIQPAILGPITLSALTLLMAKDLLRTKRCAGQECGWLFLDTTKNNRRRWCEMRVCGQPCQGAGGPAKAKTGSKKLIAGRMIGGDSRRSFLNILFSTLPEGGKPSQKVQQNQNRFFPVVRSEGGEDVSNFNKLPK